MSFSADLPTARRIAAFFVLLAIVAVTVLCRAVSPRCRRPGVLWGVAAYALGLLGVFLYGLVSSAHFETAFGTLAMLTFPFSIVTDDTIYQAGFGSLREITRNFVRYCLVYGSFDATLLTAFFWLVFPARQPRNAAPRR